MKIVHSPSQCKAICAVSFPYIQHMKKNTVQSCTVLLAFCYPDIFFLPKCVEYSSSSFNSFLWKMLPNKTKECCLVLKPWAKNRRFIDRYFQNIKIRSHDGSRYGIFTYIYHKNQPNVGKYIPCMDPFGIINNISRNTYSVSTCSSNIHRTDLPPKAKRWEKASVDQKDAPERSR